MQSCQGNQISLNVKSYLDHFEVSTEMLNKVISAAMAKGGDYADLFFEHKTSNSLGLEDGKVNRASSNIDYGVGIRVLKGDQTGYAYSETVSLDAMLNAAKLAASIANSPASYMQAPIAESIPPSYYMVDKKWEDVSVKDKIPFIQKINEKVFSP